MCRRAAPLPSAPVPSSGHRAHSKPFSPPETQSGVVGQQPATTKTSDQSRRTSEISAAAAIIRAAPFRTRSWAFSSGSRYCRLWHCGRSESDRKQRPRWSVLSGRVKRCELGRDDRSVEGRCRPAPGHRITGGGGVPSKALAAWSSHISGARWSPLQAAGLRASFGRNYRMNKRDQPRSEADRDRMRLTVR